MADFLPPSGPPPPQVPEGWKAVYNQEYKTWFYVNLHTKQSQWDKPMHPARRPGDEGDAPPPGLPPPSYSPRPGSGQGFRPDVKKTGGMESNNPYNQGHGESDEAMARRLQAEEDARSRRQGSHSPLPPGAGGSQQTGSRGQADSYYGGGGGGSGAGGYGQQQGGGYPPRPTSQGYGSQSQYQQGGLQGGYPGGPQPGSNPSQYGSDSRSSGSSGGLFGKLKDKFGGQGQQQGGYGGPGGYGQQQRPPQGGYGGGPGGYPPQPQGYYGGAPGYYPQQQQPGPYYQQQPPQAAMMTPQQKQKHGLGTGGALALGAGGLVGGMLLADAFEDHEDHMEQQAYDDGYMNGGGGDDYGGGGDDFGGDF